MLIHTDDAALAAWAGRTVLPLRRVLIHGHASPDAAAVIDDCGSFAGGLGPEEEGLIVAILYGAEDLRRQVALGAVWAFVRRAALLWAPRGLRVNAIGIGASPAGPFEPVEQAARMAGPAPAVAAGIGDVVRTIEAMAAWRSMTGQIVRLG